jgi:hypothetical protein
MTIAQALYSKAKGGDVKAQMFLVKVPRGLAGSDRVRTSCIAARAVHCVV